MESICGIYVVIVCRDRLDMMTRFETVLLPCNDECGFCIKATMTFLTQIIFAIGVVSLAKFNNSLLARGMFALQKQNYHMNTVASIFALFLSNG